MFFSISGVLPSYFSQEFSFTKFTPPDSSTVQLCHLVDSTMFVITDAGSHYKLLVNMDINKELAPESAICMNFMTA